MPHNIAMALGLFELTPTSAVLTDTWKIGELTGFRHSTRMPGGFSELSFVLPVTESEYWKWRTERMLFRLLLEEHGGKTIWEGRLEDVELQEKWLILLRWYGYWSNLTDHYHNENYNTTGDAILKDLRDTMDDDSAPALQLSTSNAEMDTGPTIDQDYQNDWTMWRIMTDPIRGVLAFGSTNDKKIDLAVWDDRILHYKERNPTSVDWQAFIKPENGAGVDRLRTRVSWSNLANAVLTVYESTGTVTRTSFDTNAASIAKYIRREYHVQNIRESSSGPADQRTDTELASRKDLQQETDGLDISRVWDTDGVEWPLCRVRAGEVIRINDFTPVTGDLDTLTLDGYRTFVIEETLCDHSRGILRIRPDRAAGGVSDLLMRSGVV